jgi:hypothetical protein
MPQSDADQLQLLHRTAASARVLRWGEAASARLVAEQAQPAELQPVNIDSSTLMPILSLKIMDGPEETQERLQRTGRAHSYEHDLTRELQLTGFNTDRAAVQRGVSPLVSWGAAAQDKEKWRKLAARLPLAPVETNPISEQARTERTQSEL